MTGSVAALLVILFWLLLLMLAVKIWKACDRVEKIANDMKDWHEAWKRQNDQS